MQSRPRVDPAFGREFGRARKAAGLTQTAVAKEIGVTKVTASAWETAKQLPELWRLADIERALGCTDGRLVRAYERSRGLASGSLAVVPHPGA